MKAVRKAITETLLQLAREDKRIFTLATDSSGSVTLTDFARELPEQFVECGIAEQDAVGIAAGLAAAGLKPFVCGPACFYAARAAEQIKVDVAYCHANVKIIGVSGGVSYGALGGTHHSVQDIALMRTFPELHVILPADAISAVKLIKQLAVSNAPAYVRVGRGEVEDIYENDADISIGQAVKLREGTDAAIIACGEMVARALHAADLLKMENLDVMVVDMHTIKPLDTDVIEQAMKTGRVVTVEEHSIYGGLGGAVSEYVVQHGTVPLRILGLPDKKIFSGTSEDVFQHYGLTAEGISRVVREFVK